MIGAAVRSLLRIGRPRRSLPDLVGRRAGGRRRRAARHDAVDGRCGGTAGCTHPDPQGRRPSGLGVREHAVLGQGPSARHASGGRAELLVASPGACRASARSGRTGPLEDSAPDLVARSAAEREGVAEGDWARWRVVPEQIEFWQGAADRHPLRLVSERRSDGWSHDVGFGEQRGRCRPPRPATCCPSSIASWTASGDCWASLTAARCCSRRTTCGSRVVPAASWKPTSAAEGRVAAAVESIVLKQTERRRARAGHDSGVSHPCSPCH